MGMPEGMYPLAQAALYLATAPKSNACNVAWHGAQAAVKEHGALPVPLKLRNAVTKLMKGDGYGEGYRYAHTDYAAMAAEGDLPPAVALQPNLPDALGARAYFEPGKQGDEARLRRWIDARRGSASTEHDELFGEDEDT